MKQKFLFFIILIFLSIPYIFSTNIDIIGEISEYGDYTEQIVFSNQTCEEFINLNFEPKTNNIILSNKTKIKDSLSYEFQNCIGVNSITYNIDDFLETINGKERLERKFNYLENYNFTYTLILPYEYKINDNDSTPNNYEIIYDDTTKKIKFEKSNLYLIYLLKEDYETNTFSFKMFFHEINEVGVIILVITSFLLGYGLSYIISIKRRNKQDQTQVPSFVLSKEEKLIIDTIKKKPGINQKQIGTELNYSKARVSSIVNDLEQKELIRRERFGRSFKVYLNKKIV